MQTRDTILLLILAAAAAAKRGGSSSAASLSFNVIESLARSVGFPDAELAAAIAMAESGGDPGALGDGGTSVGLWQIHTTAHPQFLAKDLVNPTYNAQAALGISKRGTDWKLWSTYTNGSYKRFLRTPRP